MFFFFKQKPAYEMRISDWSSDVCSSDLTPDGLRYVSMAKGLVKPSGSYARAPRRYAVALGCEAQSAGDFVDADGVDVDAPQPAARIGPSFRICPRADCAPRAFPPGHRPLLDDPDHRAVVPVANTGMHAR